VFVNCVNVRARSGFADVQAD